MRQVAPFKGGQRIVDEEGTRLFFAKLLIDGIVSRLQTQWPALGVVCVASHEVHKALADPAQGIFLRARTKSSRQGTGRNLHIAPQAGPCAQAFRLPAQDRIALRMRDYGTKALELQIVQRVIHRGWDGDFVELN